MPVYFHGELGDEVNDMAPMFETSDLHFLPMNQQNKNVKLVGTTYRMYYMFNASKLNA